MKQFLYLLTIIFALTFYCNLTVNAQSKDPKKQYTHKKHWSHRKKEAAIGAGAGAVTGLVVSKHHVKGAVIGGAVGAGAGYIIGKKKDKKKDSK